MAARRIICSSGSRPSREFSNIERYQVSTAVLGSGERKAGERVPSLTQPLQKEEEEEKEEVDYYSGICPRTRIFWFILLVWHGEREGAGR